jgi:hypothetical protein
MSKGSNKNTATGMFPSWQMGMLPVIYALNKMHDYFYPCRLADNDLAKELKIKG